MTAARNWTAAQLAALGTDSDAAVARRFKLPKASVGKERRRLKIPPGKLGKPHYNKPTFRPWTATEISLLGTEPDSQIGQRITRTTLAVRNERIRRKIPAALPRIKCPTCGRKFRKQTPAQKHCGEKCRMVAVRQQKRDSRKSAHD